MKKKIKEVKCVCPVRIVKKNNGYLTECLYCNHPKNKEMIKNKIEYTGL